MKLFKVILLLLLVAGIVPAAIVGATSVLRTRDLLVTDAQAVNGVLYNGNATKRNEANNVFSAVNQAGGI